MLSRAGACFWLGFSISLLAAGCQERGTAEQGSRPLPMPEPPASPSAARADATVAAKKRSTSDEPKEGSKPKPTADRGAEKPPVVTAPAPAVSGAVATGGAANAVALPTSSPINAPSAPCLNRCQGAMQGCLSAPVDGGVPGFGNLDLCKKALEACQNACANP